MTWIHNTTRFYTRDILAVFFVFIIRHTRFYTRDILAVFFVFIIRHTYSYMSTLEFKDF